VCRASAMTEQDLALGLSRMGRRNPPLATLEGTGATCIEVRMTARKDPTGIKRPWLRTSRNSNGYTELFMPWHPNALRSGYIREHVWVMSRMVGSPVPKGFEVHHMDGDKQNNSPSNLMLCTRAQHQHMHKIMHAVNACGNPDWRPCRFCHKHDSTDAMIRHSRTRDAWCHSECRKISWHNRKHRYVSTKDGSRLRPSVVPHFTRKRKPVCAS
jgi:hypothetical protein